MVKKEVNVVWLLFAAFAGGIVTIASLALARQTRPAPIEIQPPPPTIAPAATPTGTPLRVYLSGAVGEAGVYEVPAGSILADAVSLAGDLSAEAAAEFINLALPLRDGMHIHVPYRDEMDGAAPVVVDKPGETNGAGFVNINTATSIELETLPGVGPATAQKIIAFREESGPFVTIEDIMLVAGIGEAKFAAMKDLIAVR